MVVTTKPDNTPLTAADIEAHHIISQVLTPYGTVISEEGIFPWNERNSEEEFWLVDPLDGTKEWAAGGDDFAICISRLVKEEVQLSVTHFSALGETYSLFRGHWPRLHTNEGSSPIPNRSCLNKRWRVVTSKSTKEDPLLARLCNPHWELDQISSCANKLVEVATGRADLYYNPGGKCHV